MPPAPNASEHAAAQRVVRVLPDVPALGRRFDYLVPEGDNALVRVGTRVRISLAGRRVGGWVVEDRVQPPPGVALRALAKVSGLGPPSDVVALADWAAWRWAGPAATFLRTASPDQVVRSLPMAPRWAPGPGSGPAGMASAAAGAGEKVAAAGAARTAGEIAPEPAGDRIGELVAEALSAPGQPLLALLPPATDRFVLITRFIRATLARRDGSVLVLAPELEPVADLAGRLARAGFPVAHGGQEWARAAAGWPVVVGSRAGAWAPVPELAGVLVLDAHDERYREERAPTFDAAAVAVERAARTHAPCLLTSPTPTVVQYGETRRWRPGRVAERDGWPALKVVDLRTEDPRHGLLTEAFVALGRAVLGGAFGGGALLCVLQRRGRARLLACAACGSLARCERCGHAVTQDGGELQCQCGQVRPLLCVACGSTRLRVLRPGVARVAEDVAALFKVPVVEVSGPPHGPVAPGRIYVGTEAVLHRFAQAAAVAFLDFDQHLLAPRFTAGEAALALLGRAARIAGGRRAFPTDGSVGVDRGRGGSLLVQTRLPDHEVLRAVAAGDPATCLDAELALRRELALPPDAALALLTGPAAEQHAAAVAAQAGSVTAAGLDEARWLLHAPDHATLCNALAAMPRPRGRLRIEVDPTGV